MDGLRISLRISFYMRSPLLGAQMQLNKWTCLWIKCWFLKSCFWETTACCDALSSLRCNCPQFYLRQVKCSSDGTVFNFCTLKNCGFLDQCSLSNQLCGLSQEEPEFICLLPFSVTFLKKTVTNVSVPTETVHVDSHHIACTCVTDDDLCLASCFGLSFVVDMENN